MTDKVLVSVSPVGAAMNLLKEAMEEIDGRISKIEAFIILSMQDRGLTPKEIHDIMEFGRKTDVDIE
jgi:hypothetical protein